MLGIASTLRLQGRRSECDKLVSLLAASKAGRGEALVLRGEAGIGKTALLHFLIERAVGCHVTRAAGARSEMELVFGGLHQLCAPFADRLNKVPLQQREALETTFGLRAGDPPDRSLVGMAALSLLSEVAEERPLVCVVDDAQWLDQASSQALQFVARRLAGERIALVVAVRDSDAAHGFVELPELVVHGLDSTDAAALLDSALNSPLEPRVRDRILAECIGNPLALLEASQEPAGAGLAFTSDVSTISRPLIERLLHQLAPLSQQCRQLLLIAAAEPVGDVFLLWRAAMRLGVQADAANAAEEAGLIDFRDRVRFSHPLVRSTVYRLASPAERRAVHQALADATDPDLAPDRRAWHRANAVIGRDEEVAAELERSAGRAFSHGGLAAAAAFLAQAATLTPDPVRRVRRCLDAARTKVAAGDFDGASALLATADVGPLGESEAAEIELLQAQMSFDASKGNEALPLLLSAARRLEGVDPDLARDTYLDAFSAALFAGRLAVGPGARQVAEAARQAPPPRTSRKGDLLLHGLTVLFSDGYTSAAPITRRAVKAFASEGLAMDEALRFSWLAASAAVSQWDDAGWDQLTRRHIQIARDSGALSTLPLALTSRVFVDLLAGDLSAADSLVQDFRAVSQATTARHAPYGEVALLAFRGDPLLAEPPIQHWLDDATVRGEGVGVTMMQWARSVLCNGLGRYDEAQRAAAEAAADPLELGPPKWALVELVEAAARSGNTDVARTVLEQLSAMAAASGTDWALGAAAGRRALLLKGRDAEDHYQEAIARLARTRVHLELARAQLLYGEWLRRQGRRVDARAQLRAAHAALTGMGVNAFAERARRELLATGETARKRTVDTSVELTAQEGHIASLAARGLTNPEIGASLYLSTKTVEWHLRKIFLKLGVSTRRELASALPENEHAAS